MRQRPTVSYSARGLLALAPALPALAVPLSGCPDAGFGVVSISPIYGWSEGCNRVTISGHGFREGVRAKVGIAELTEIDQPERAIDQGYLFTGEVPEGTPGYADVTVWQGTESDSLQGTARYYFVACPGMAIDTVEAQCEATAGGSVTLTGCGLDPAAIDVQLVDAAGAPVAAPAALAAECRTGRASFTVPDLAPGTYWIELVGKSGDVLLGAPCDAAVNECSMDAPPDSGGGDTSLAPDSAAADTGSVCVDYPLVVVAAEGGAQ